MDGLGSLTVESADKNIGWSVLSPCRPYEVRWWSRIGDPKTVMQGLQTGLFCGVQFFGCRERVPISACSASGSVCTEYCVYYYRVVVWPRDGGSEYSEEMIKRYLARLGLESSSGLQTNLCLENSYSGESSSCREKIYFERAGESESSPRFIERTIQAMKKSTSGIEDHTERFQWFGSLSFVVARESLVQQILWFCREKIGPVKAVQEREWMLFSTEKDTVQEIPS
jgi:hypothetical protein